MLTRTTALTAVLLMSAWPALAQDATTEAPAEAPAAEATAQPATDAAAPEAAAPEGEMDHGAMDHGEMTEGEMAEAQPSDAVPGEMASMIAELTGAEGESLGTVTVAPTPSGVLLATITLEGAPEGTHGIHFHETGTCTPPDFESAGGHVAGESEHGVMSEGGAHPGDMPNVHVPADGVLTVEYFVPDLTTEMLTDDDGAAIVLHAQPDDYSGQPSGNAGERLACGALSATE